MYLVGADGTGARVAWALKGKPGFDAPWADEAVWSPTGKRLAILAVVNAHSDLHVLDEGAKAARRLTRGAQPGLGQFFWSGDGRWLAFWHSEGSLNVVSAGGGQRRLVCKKCGNAYLLSPTGRQVAYAVDAQPETYSLWVGNVDGTGKRRLASLTTGSFSWSPDGARLAFAALLADRQHSKIAVAPLDGGKVEELTEGLHYDDSLTWSPSEKLLFARSADADQYERFVLYIVGADGAGLAQLTRVQPRRVVVGASFSSDGGGEEGRELHLIPAERDHREEDRGSRAVRPSGLVSDGSGSRLFEESLPTVLTRPAYWDRPIRNGTPSPPRR